MFIDPYRWHTVRITRIVHESPDAVSLFTERPEGYSFLAGQHAIIRATLSDGSQRLRQYSFAGTPDKNELYFTITRSQGGDVSNWAIDHASTKSLIDISQAFTGPLQQDLASYKTIGLIGGGSGIVPLMAHIRTLRQNDSTQHISLLYSTRSTSRCFVDELKKRGQNEHIVVRLTDLAERFSEGEIINAMQECDIVLLCGSRNFVTNIQKILHDALPNLTTYGEAFSLQ